MLEPEKAYIAGIIDGEGSIMLQKFHSNEFPAPCVSIASTSLELLIWIKKTVEKGIIISKKNYNPEVHKDCYSYVLRRNDAIYLIKEIYAYLNIDSKRKRAELIVKNYKTLTPRSGHYSLEMLEAKESFYNEFMAIK